MGIRNAIEGMDVGRMLGQRTTVENNKRLEYCEDFVVSTSGKVISQDLS
jgi:hypothetical protein